MLSRLPVWTGSDAELPSGRPPLLMSFSQGVLLTEDRKQSMSVRQPSRGESTLWMFLTSASATMLGAVGRVQGRLVLLGVLLFVLLHQTLLLGPAQREDLLLSLSVLLVHRCKHTEAAQLARTTFSSHYTDKNIRAGHLLISKVTELIKLPALVS